MIRVWDLETGDVRVFDPGDRERITAIAFLPGGKVLWGGAKGLRLWDMQSGTHRTVRPEPVAEIGDLRMSADGRSLRCKLDPQDPAGRVETLTWDFATDTWTHFAFGTNVFDDAGTTYWYDKGNILFLGRVRGRDRGEPVLEEPHLVCKIRGFNGAVDIAPNGTQAAIGCNDGSVYVVPIHQGVPLQTLPRREFLARLRATTNVYAVRDANADEGYRLEATTFPGWKTLPEW